MTQLSRYNALHKKNKIRRLFLLDNNGMREIELQ